MWYILNKNLEKIGAFNTGSSLDLLIESDSLVEKLEQGVRTIEFVADSKHEKSKMFEKENYIVVPNTTGGNHFLFKISEVETTNSGLEATTRVFGESTHVHDLTGSTVRPVKLVSRTLAQALEIVLNGTDWKVGNVEYSKVYTKEIKDYPTALQAVFDFTDEIKDCSVDFVVEMRGGKLVSKKVDVVHLGESQGSMFSFDRNLNGLTKKVNIEEIYSAILPLGKGSNDEYLTIASAIGNVTLPSGYEFLGTDSIGHIESKDLWSPNSYRTFVYQDDSAESWLDLYNKALKKLDEIKEPKIEYTCDIEMLETLGYSLSDFSKGDYVTIQDHEFELYLQARVSEKTTSTTNPDDGSIILSNFKKLDLKKSQALQSLQSKLLLKESSWNEAVDKAQEALDGMENIKNPIIISDEEPADPGENALWLDTSSEPNVMKRWDGNSWVSAGSDGQPGPPGEDGKQLYIWIKYADDAEGTGMSNSPAGKRFLGLASNKETPEESSNVLDYTWSPLFDNVIVGGRNLIKNSKKFQPGSNASGITSSLTEEGYLKIVSLSGNGNWHKDHFPSEYYNLIEDELEEGTDFTISFTVKAISHSGSNPSIYLKNGLGYYPMIGTLSENFSRIYWSGKWKKGNPISLQLGFGSSIGEYHFKDVKLEKGNVPTDWTPAPEDSLNLVFAGSTPLNPVIDQLWMDTSITPNQIYRWNGESWVSTVHAPKPDQVKVSDTEPENPTHNTMWLNTSIIPNQLLRFHDPNGDALGEWVSTYEDKEEIIQAVVQSQQIESMFGNKADKSELDVLATTESLNNRFQEAQNAQAEITKSVDARLTPIESQIGDIESKIEATKNELSIKFSSKASGINLIKNSLGWANGFVFNETSAGVIQKTRMIDFWGYGENASMGSSMSNSSQFNYIDSYELDNYGSAWTSTTAGQTARTFQQVPGLKIGETYTVGALFKKATTVAADQCLIRLYWYNTSTASYVQIGTSIGLTNASGKVDDWRFASVKFVAPSDNVYVQIEIVSSITQQSSITCIMMNEGDLPYGWTPHKEEIYSTGVSFNINGIRVRSGNNYTQMTSSDFSGYVLEGINQTPRRIFSLNGDTTEVANLESEDSIKMGSIKIVKSASGWQFMRNI